MRPSAACPANLTLIFACRSCFIFLVGWLLMAAPGVFAQAVDPWTLPKEERDAWFARIRGLSGEDHQRLMQQLGITTLRPGANGNDPTAPNAANYDESKANPFPELPDPLVMKDGSKVTSASQWWNKRRGELLLLLDEHMYGRTPAHIPAVKWTEVSRASDTVAGKPVIVRMLTGHVDNTSFPSIVVDMRVTVVTPATAQRVPVILELSFNFPPGFIRQETTPGPDWKQQLISKGWGYAQFIPTSVQADNGAGLTEGIIGLVNKGSQRDPGEWGALKAWAWGASRVLDLFETDVLVDARRVGITGHSRYGKAAAVAMAYDQRFAIGYISSSGEGGLKINRRNFGEIIENVAGSGEYHWMAGNFIRYAGPLTGKDLPVDGHSLLALCAPRPVFTGCGMEGDQWVDPMGTFMACVAASPVYELLSKRGISKRTYPEPEETLDGGDVAFRQHRGGHTPAPNWPAFIAFAERYFGGSTSK